MGTDSQEFIGEMYRLVGALHNEFDWSKVKTEEENEQRSQHYQSCLSQVRHFYSDADSWLLRESGNGLMVLSIEEQRRALLDYAVLIEHRLKKYLSVTSEDDWWWAIR